MISIELIFPLKDKRLCVRVDESISIGEFRSKLCKFFNVKNEGIFMLTIPESVSDDISLSEAGMYT